MPIFWLPKEIQFPNPELADEEGVLALGGDLKMERLLEAYRNGIFPWYAENEPIIWWSPDPRFVLYPDKLKISKSMRQVLNRKIFNITFDQDFESVIRNCRQIKRKGQWGTWITREVLTAYCQLHNEGYAHSVEVWREGNLVGGLYGVSLGKCFFGESMFSRESNASKAGFIALAKKLKQLGFHLIDCQVYTKHLESLGAEHISRKRFLAQLEGGLKFPTMKGNWGKLDVSKEEK